MVGWQGEKEGGNGMLPVFLKMKDFLSYENETFDFSKISCATVTGENGAGKSSFCTDAITFALYGIGTKGGIKELDNYVRKGANSGTVEFTFDIGDERYKVVRTRSIAKGKTSLAFFTVTKSGIEIPLGDGKVTSTQELIESTLHMNYRTFASSAMIAQGKSAMFTEGMTDNERKEALIEIMDVDSWSDIGEEASERVRDLKAEIRSVQSLIDNAQTDDMDFLKQQEQCIRSRMKESESLAESKKKIIEANHDAAFRSESILREADEITSRIEESKNLLSSKEKRSSSAVSSTRKAENELSVLEGKRAAAAFLVASKDKVNADFAAWTEADALVKDLEDRKMSVLQKGQELQRVIQDGKTWNSAHESMLKQADIHIENRRKQAEALESVPCAGNDKLTSSCRFLGMARQAKDELEKFEKRRAEIARDVNPHRDEYVRVNAEYKNLESGFSEDHLKEAKKKLAALDGADKRKQSLEMALDRMALLDDAITSKKVEIAEKSEQEKSLSEEIEILKEKIDGLSEKVSAKKSEADSFKEKTEAYTEAQTELEKLEASMKGLELDIFRVQAKIEQAEKTVKETEERKKKLLSLQDELATASLLVEACSKKSGVPAFIVENAVPEIEDTANEMLDRMTNGKLELRFSMQEDSKTRKTVQETLRIKVSYYGEERSYETFSGAEKFIIDLSIRIALSKFLAHRAGTNMQLFVLDEGVSCADESNREEIMDAIKSISSEFKKILFVTHITELKDIFGQRIVITKDSRGSHIKVE